MSPTLEDFQVFLRERNEALTPWHCIFQCEGACSHSCQRIRQSLHPIGTVTHSRLRTQSLSAWDLQMGIWATRNKLLLMAGEQRGRPKNSFFSPILHTLNNGWVNWCCLVPRDHRVTSEGAMLSLLHAELADCWGSGTQISLRRTEHFRWWLTALAAICMIMSLFSVYYSADGTARKKQIGASRAAAPGERESGWADWWPLAVFWCCSCFLWCH